MRLINFSYLISLVISIFGLMMIDKKYNLVFWYSFKTALKTIAIGLIFFLIWDLAGISLGIFFHGQSNLTLPIRLAPELPLEEIFFLFLLNYLSLIIYRIITKR